MQIKNLKCEIYRNTGNPTSTKLVYSDFNKQNMIYRQIEPDFGGTCMLTLFVESAKRINCKACERN